MTKKQADWRSIDSAPEGVVVWTKIDDPYGVRNLRKLKRQGGTWFVPDGTSCVFYEPNYWRPTE